MAHSRSQEEGFRRFVEAHWHALVRTACLLVGDHGRAEDLVQQTLVRVHRRWSRLDTAGAPTAYVRAALVNQAISNARRKRVQETLFGRDSADEGSSRAVTDPHDAYRAIDDRDALLRALRDLPPRMRAVVVLRYFDDLTEAATAEALGMSVGSVKSQTSRGLARLRTALTESTAEGSMR